MTRSTSLPCSHAPARKKPRAAGRRERERARARERERERRVGGGGKGRMQRRVHAHSAAAQQRSEQTHLRPPMQEETKLQVLPRLDRCGLGAHRCAVAGGNAPWQAAKVGAVAGLAPRGRRGWGWRGSRRPGRRRRSQRHPEGGNAEEAGARHRHRRCVRSSRPVAGSERAKVTRE